MVRLGFWGWGYVDYVTRLRIAVLRAAFTLKYTSTVTEDNTTSPGKISPVEVVSDPYGDETKEDQ